MGRFLTKLIANSIFAIPMLMWFGGATFLASLITAVIFCGIAYVLGDQMVLRVSNNLTATLVDAVFAYLYFWGAAALMDWTLSYGELLSLAVVLGIVELIYHRFLINHDEDELEGAR